MTIKVDSNYISCYCRPLVEPDIKLKEGEKEDDYSYISIRRKEITAWLNQLKRTFPFEADHLKFKEIKEGIYSVVVQWDPEKEDFGDRALDLVDELPYNWDYKAKEELGEEYFNRLKEQCYPEKFKECDKQKL